MTRRWLHGLLLTLATTPLAAQTSDCGDASGGGVIRGSIEDIAGAAIQNGLALLPALKCQALAARDGQFALRSVPPGAHLLKGAFIGYYRFDTTVVVAAQETLTVVLRLVRAGDVLRHNCRAWPVCPQVPSDTSLALAAFRTLTWFARDLPDFSSRQQCVGVVDSANRALPFTLLPGTWNARACRIDTSGTSVMRSSGKPAIEFWVTLWAVKGDQAKVSLWARAEWSAGGAWGCDFQRGVDGWRASACSSGDIEPYHWLR